MKVVRSIKKMQLYAARIKRQNKAIGFVPTMGYLHQGHISLIEQAKKDSDVVVMSIFVNPAQFGPREDFKEYPRNFKSDCRLAKSAGVDIVFHPSISAMYPKDYQTYIDVILLSKYLCGKSRPGHFRGVATVVAKLFNIVKPNIAYFGQKDAQQAIIIKKMASDLNMDLKIRVMPIVRESDGLAMSSRNSYLNPTARQDALVLKNALQMAKDMIKSDEKDPKRIISRIKKRVRTKPSANIDYISIVDAATLQDLKSIKGKILIALAVRIGSVRLIDNVTVTK